MLAGAYIDPFTLAGVFTLDQIMAMDPAKFPRVRAWCTDLYSGSPDYCISDGTQWKPVRPYGLQTATVSGTATMVLTAMTNAPTQIIGGALALGATLGITLATNYAYRGAPFLIARAATGAGAMLINGLGLSLGLKSWAKVEFDGAAWVQTQSGGLL